MEAVAALGLAANICQFVEYGFKIVIEAKRLRDSGSTSLDPSLERDTRHMKRLAIQLDSRKSPSYMSADQEALDSLAVECLDLSNDLLTLVETLKAKRPKSKVDSIRAVLRNKRRNEDKFALEKKLDRCRSQLQIQLAAMTRSEMHEKLDDIIKSKDKVGDEFKSIQQDMRALRSSLDSKQDSQASLSHIQTILDITQDAISRMHQSKVIDALRFPSMNERFQDVGPADKVTFSWVFATQTDVNEDHKNEKWPQRLLLDRQARARDTFIDWLRDRGGIFHVSGKLGSGKSTLMKYICCHKELTRFLHLWAGDKKLIVAKFFFWKPDESQNSWKALLRSLLFQILSASPDLIPLAFPEQWNAFQGLADSPAAFGEGDIRQAFDNIFEQKQLIASKRFAFFIDGLDELKGSHIEMTRTLSEWVRKTPDDLKICVSSRDWNVFREAFEGCPQFKIHDLTGQDIANLVSTKVKANPYWQALDEETRELALIRPICTKAEGVFLWVSLVLETVDEALLNGDSLTKIQKKINLCPVEIEGLFHHLLSSIHKCDREWAFRALFIPLSLNIFELPTSIANTVTLLQYSFLDEYFHDNDFAIKQLVSTCQDTTINRRLDITRRQIYGRCRGFLEVRRANLSTFPDCVLFVHRSIIEFLQTSEAMALMQPYIAAFDLFDALCQTLLAQIKSSISKDHLVLSNFLMESVDTLMKTFRLSIRLQKMKSLRWFVFLREVGQLIYNVLPQEQKMIQARLLDGYDVFAEPAQIIHLAALQYCAYEYLEWSLGDAATTFFDQHRTACYDIMHLMMLSSPTTYITIPQQRRVEALEYCFSQGVSPNFTTRFDKISAWHGRLWLRMGGVDMFLGRFQETRFHSVPFMDVFLRYGASPNFTVEFRDLVIQAQDGSSWVPVAAFSDGVLVPRSDVSVIKAEHPLVKLAQTKNNVLTLRDIIEIWVPQHAAVLQRLIDHAPTPSAAQKGLADLGNPLQADWDNKLDNTDLEPFVDTMWQVNLRLKY
ncbi:hypothetical protein F5B20DRAFT_533601, partial [Whalleya microplaca]